ncbi:hypothetical protein BC941DRAFT_364317, partial [Chlamydoabsidia padenii]
NRYNSFAPIRNNSNINWHVDGHDYFEASIEAILSAKSYMYLSAWWISPEVYLRRPVHEGDNENYRFDKLLKKKAEEGVDIYVVLYKALVSLGSTYVKHHLENLHPRIHGKKKNIQIPTLPHRSHLLISFSFNNSLISDTKSCCTFGMVIPRGKEGIKNSQYTTTNLFECKC